jgi:16S rRNA (guanine(1405)-N(7))-methyltransferase
MKLSNVDIQEMIDHILTSKKYRDSGLNQNTIRNLIIQEARQHQSQKEHLKSVKRKLHNIVAPYLGEPDYKTHSTHLEEIQVPAIDSPEIKAFCKSVLAEHASTKERLPIIDEFYERVFSHTGKPDTLLDLACGMHPLAFPWMGLPLSIHYYAYDIIQPRVEFINHFFTRIGLSPLAENRDILVNPPKIKADLALIFKEAHRMEKRQPGCNQHLWTNLDAEILAVSLPTQNLSGTHSLVEQHRALVQNNLPKKRSVEELLFENEIVFLIRKISG